jgi:hypothetical protein
MSIMLAGLLVGDVVSEPVRYEKENRIIEAGVQHRETAQQPGLSSVGGVCGRLFKPSRSELWANQRDRCGYLQVTEGNQGQLTVSAGGGQGLFDLDLRKYSRGRAVAPVSLVLQKFPTGFEGISRRRR